MAEVEITVEAALAELREMFPNASYELDISDFYGVAADRSAYHYQEFAVYLGLSKIGGTSATLTDCMAQVRAWKSTQRSSSKKLDNYNDGTI